MYTQFRVGKYDDEKGGSTRTAPSKSMARLEAGDEGTEEGIGPIYIRDDSTSILIVSCSCISGQGGTTALVVAFLFVFFALCF